MAKKTDEPVFRDVGVNIRAKRVGDTLIMRVDLSEKGKLSESGKSYVVAKTNRFESLEEVCDEEIGLMLTVTRRVSKKKKTKPRDDDDEGDD